MRNRLRLTLQAHPNFWCIESNMVRRAWWQNTARVRTARGRATLHDRGLRMRAGILPSSPIRTMLDPISNMQLYLIFFYTEASFIGKLLSSVKHTRTCTYPIYENNKTINIVHRTWLHILRSAYIFICNHWTCPCSGYFLWISLQNWHFCSNIMYYHWYTWNLSSAF